jgi:predicted nucleic-acid-binding protein
VIGLDTNVLVRYLTQDEPDQAASATRLIEHELTEASPGFVGLVVLIETTWVLQRLYRVQPEEIRETVSQLLGSRTIVIENREVVARALTICETNACGFADAVIAASAAGAGCDTIMTFDRGATRAGMTLLE